MRRTSFIAAVAALLVSLLAAASAQAIVLTDQGNKAGVVIVPAQRGAALPAGVAAVTSSGSCEDPWLSSDFGGPILPSGGLCWHTGGSVAHANETFAFTWDPARRYWQSTRNYVERFLSDVAAGSGTLGSPYADSTQYHDSSGRAGNKSLFGGGCIDFGGTGGSSCQFGTNSGTGAGHSYPASGCPVSGTNQFAEDPSGNFGDAPNDICLTDAQLRGEVQSMVAQTGMLGHTASGYTPMVVLLTPPGVETCLDTTGTLCSANSGATARFCSYHAIARVNGSDVPYVVQPWTATWTSDNGCDDAGVPDYPNPVSAQALATQVGMRLVSPLSQAQMATITDPFLNGWFARNGSEVNDNGCQPEPKPLDEVAVGSSAQNPYFLQHEFNNGGAIASDPNSPICTPNVNLVPSFVVPSAVNQGDEVQLDGSTTISTLLVPRAAYRWSFGDGTTATGPSVVHSYGARGSYRVTLTVTDRGGNVQSLAQTLSVAGSSGVPPTPSTHSSGLHVRLQLMPQGLRAMLRHGLSLRLSSNEPATGVAYVSISRTAARRAHITLGHGRAVVIGRGTVASVSDGTVSLHLHLSHTMVAKLRHLRHLTVTVRFVLFAADGDHVAVDAAARY